MKKNIPQSPTIYQLVYLIRKAKKERLTEDERSILQEWLNRDMQNLELYNKLLSDDHSDKMKEMRSKDTFNHYATITKAARLRESVQSVSYGSVVAAASVALYFLFAPLVSEQPDDSITPAEGESDLITLHTGAVREDLPVH